jgi:Na+-transporting NADH:ubiquinone oxidoreductase subunit F
MGILVTILSITGISTVLSIMIVVAERFLNDYGECEIDINEGERKIATEGGSSLLSSLAKKRF